ncbi:MAG: folate family ECF transporter S component [Clostridia bacterium]|nr:folate family ECF transporter S component [Clostridia bacterium]MBO7245438.1 folate family ECF transporter S component [Clostridia bacterium]
MPKTKKSTLFSLRTMVCCAMMIAIAVVMARLMSIVPEESSRFSLEAVPIFVSGMLFGPVAGAAVGFLSDLIGCLFSPFGYNPLFCLPPVICGLTAGLFRRYLVKKTSVFRIAVAYLPYILLACILWQSFALALVYGGEAKTAYFLTKLATRSVQYGITYVIDVILVWILYKSKVFTAAKLWQTEKEA